MKSLKELQELAIATATVIIDGRTPLYKNLPSWAFTDPIHKKLAEFYSHNDHLDDYPDLENEFELLSQATGIDLNYIQNLDKLFDEEFDRLEELYEGDSNRAYRDLEPANAVVTLLERIAENSRRKDEINILIRRIKAVSTKDPAAPDLNKQLEQPPRADIVSGVIPESALVFAFGQSEQGKTFVAIDMLWSIAVGSGWAGRECQQGGVLYISAEDAQGVKGRNQAQLINRGLTSYPAGFQTLDATGCLLDKNLCDRIVSECYRVEARSGLPMKMIVLDPWANLLSGDENSTSDSMAGVRLLQGVMQQVPGCTVMPIHHSGLGKGRMRGSTVLRSAADVELYVHNGQVRFTKTKNSAKQKPIHFNLRPVQIGLNAQTGEAITSCVANYGEDNKPAGRAKTVSPIVGMGESVGRKFYAENGLLTLENWRDVFYEVRRQEKLTPNQTALRVSFNAMVGKLLELNVVSENNGLFVFQA